MPMSRLAPPINRPPADPVAAFRACHERIRTFTAGLHRIAALPDLADPRVPSAAGQARRDHGLIWLARLGPVVARRA